MSAGPPRPIDLLVRGASGVATCAPGGRAPTEPARGVELADLGWSPGAAIAVSDGVIAGIGSEEALGARFDPRERLDAQGGVVIPGLVDSHTHPVFAEGREEEFERKVRGESYQQIAAAGGGILSSVRGVRSASDEDLEARVQARLERFLDLGTTTVEAKSGYGLTARDELRSLRAIRRAARRFEGQVVSTLLAAHALPPEFRENRDRWLRIVREEIAPAAAAEGLATFHDAFVDRGFFTVEEAREILDASRSLGLLPKLHADELGWTGSTELAVELGAASADHLDHVGDAGIERLASSGTVAVLLPGVSHFLRAPGDAPARRLVEAGAAVALATDFNPGTCPTASMFEVMHLAAVRMRLAPSEALVASTRNAAFALGLGGKVGFLAVGSRADLVVCDVPDPRDLAYCFGRPPVAWVVAGGRVVRRPSRARAALV